MSWFVHLEKSSLNFSSLLIVICVNLLHPRPFLFLYGLLLFLWCFSIFFLYYFQVSSNLKKPSSWLRNLHVCTKWPTCMFWNCTGHFVQRNTFFIDTVFTNPIIDIFLYGEELINKGNKYIYFFNQWQFLE